MFQLLLLPSDNSSEIQVLWKQGNPSVSFPSVRLGNLSVPIWLSPCGSYLVVRLDGEHPSSGHIGFRLDFLQVDEIKNFVVHPGLVL